MPIKNLSDARRLPRLGTIALGVKKTNSAGKEYPTEVDYFVVSDKVKAVFGDKPKELRIMFPVSQPEVFFQQWYKCYGSSALKCKGDGERADTWDEENGGLKNIPCPCPKLEAGECKPIGTLQFLIPEVDGAGVWQITTSSKNSIIDINSSIDFIRAIAGRIHMIPLVLKREERNMTRTEGGKQKKSTHYTMKIDVAAGFTLKQLQAAAQVQASTVLLPPADESKDELLYPANGFSQETERVEDEGPNALDQDLPEPGATMAQLAEIATWTDQLKERGKGGKVVDTEISRVAKERHGINLAKEDLTVEAADTVIAFLKSWAANYDSKKNASL
jgi:hypothetical protein